MISVRAAQTTGAHGETVGNHHEFNGHPIWWVDHTNERGGVERGQSAHVRTNDGQTAQTDERVEETTNYENRQIGKS